MRNQIAAVAAVLLSATSAQAAGFLLNTQGAKGTGRAHAYVADPKDASAIFHNVGAIGRLKGTQLYIGGSLIAPDQTYDGPEGFTEMQVSIVPTAHFYATSQVVPGITVGLGVNSPYGSGLEWGPDSPGRQLVREISLRTFYITPSVGVDLDTLGVPGLSFGGGIDFVPASAYLRQDILFSADEVAQAELSGNDLAFGARAGFVYNPPFAPDAHLGVSYRLPVAFNFSGQGDFDSPDYLRDQLPVDGDGSVELELPSNLKIGFAYDFTQNLQVEVNAHFDGWSTYDNLILNLPPNPDGSENDPTVLRRDWEDTWSFRIGGEYAEEEWAIRAGYEYDPTPVPDDTLDFTLVDVDRNVLTAGGSFLLSDNIAVDASFWYLFPRTRVPGPEPFNPPFKGEYEVSAFVATVGLSFTLDGASAIDGTKLVGETVPAGQATAAPQ
ncbi:MAG: outer membrane protein transport protein [Myxococcota bacterium]